MIRRSFSVVSVMAMAGLVSACAVLKTPDPVQTYRFGGTPVFAASGASSCEAVTVALRRVDFADASSGDRILAVTGTETAYIGGARWVSQAETLFQAALEDGFAAGAPCINLAAGPFTRDGLLLSVDVRRFETVYAAAGSAPEVKMVVAAQLVRPGDRSVVASTRLDLNEAAGSNRISSIVAAYDQASNEAVRQLVSWTASEAAKAR